ncbi:hypothetical protein [Cerasicoccus arenae]|uniref:DUF2017 domain-containing protein n=1 Tax=Cerasicoccus arenae TaxID=424488 RepID=A0A8J3DBS9_9BACT|nr:hypothetical protein [Cerasicoccus arenae]MBK1858742.1 hypothetical protein [Cerasicoccus arenae]GHC07250.1 hypothetical protein GCM10007047_25390 [Cerasicoccus arenae]
MPKLSIQISPHFLQALMDVVEPIEQRLHLQVAISLDSVPDDDELLLEAWRDSLLEQLREDGEYLIHLLRKMLSEESLTLTDEEAESTLRAASAIRLKIREVFLSRFSEEALERDQVDMARLGPEERKPYLCFMFLARFQEALVAQLMPDFYDFNELFEEDED